jgi:glycerol uptake facilitator protein
MGWGDAAFPDRVGGFFYIYVLAPLLGGVVASSFFVRVVERAMNQPFERCHCEPDKSEAREVEAR